MLGSVHGTAAPREVMFGYHGRPGTRVFKAMARDDRHKLIFLANGGHRLLFDLTEDPNEVRPIQDIRPGVTGFPASPDAIHYEPPIARV